mmetsp:Transcript_10974/g.28629  ORF Transcript_10974/g.28629 Transcript_10974/m.28629 type:complete len:222 (-) Transcript_10974:393-1058(-)
MPGKKRGAKREGLAWPTRVTLADGSNGLFAGCTTSSPRLWSRTMYKDSMRPDVSMGTNEGTARGSASQSSTSSAAGRKLRSNTRLRPGLSALSALAAEPVLLGLLAKLTGAGVRVSALWLAFHKQAPGGCSDLMLECVPSRKSELFCCSFWQLGEAAGKGASGTPSMLLARKRLGRCKELVAAALLRSNDWRSCSCCGSRWRNPSSEVELSSLWLIKLNPL